MQLRCLLQASKQTIIKLQIIGKLEIHRILDGSPNITNQNSAAARRQSLYNRRLALTVLGCSYVAELPDLNGLPRWETVD